MILPTDPPMLGGGTQPAFLRGAALAGPVVWFLSWEAEDSEQRAGDTRPHSPHPLSLGEAARDMSACLGFITVEHGFCPGPSFPMRKDLENALSR